MKKKTWTKKSLGKHQFTGSWVKYWRKTAEGGVSRYFLLESPTYGASFEYNGPPSAKSAGWRAK